MDKLITMDDTEYKSLIAEKEAAQDYIKRLEDALLIFNIDPKNTTIDFRDVAMFYVKARRDEQAMLDAAQARVKELEAMLDALKLERHNESVRSGERIQWFTRRCADLEAERDLWQKNHEALRVKMIDLEAAISQATAQISAQSAELDRVYTDRDTLKQHVLSAEGRVKDLEAQLEKLNSACPPTLHLDPASAAVVIAELEKLSSAGIKVDPTRDYNAEIVAARIDALKTLGVNPYDPPICIAGAAKRRAKTMGHAEKLEADVAAVWELWGAGREREPGKLHEICQEQERLSSALESKLRVIAEKLDAAKVPTHYGRDQKGGPVAITERVDLLIASHDCALALADAWETSSMREAEERVDAAAVLDELGAPDQAGSIHLSTAARIRALPGLLRP